MQNIFVGKPFTPKIEEYFSSLPQRIENNRRGFLALAGAIAVILFIFLKDSCKFMAIGIFSLFAAVFYVFGYMNAKARAIERFSQLEICDQEGTEDYLILRFTGENGQRELFAVWAEDGKIPEGKESLSTIDTDEVDGFLVAIFHSEGASAAAGSPVLVLQKSDEKRLYSAAKFDLGAPVRLFKHSFLGIPLRGVNPPGHMG